MQTTASRLFMVFFSALGFSFYYSMALTNIAFYLTVLAGIILFICSKKAERTLILRQLLLSHALKAVLLWIVVLYIGALYAPDGADILMYAGKYKKFIFLFFLLYGFIYFARRNIDLSRYFLQGLIWGGVTLFVLSLMGKVMGLEGATFRNGYWVPAGWFVTPLLFSIIAVIGIVFLSKKRWITGGFLLLIGLFEVFYVMQQRTAYLTLFIAMVYLIWILPIGKLRYKTILAAFIALIAGLIMVTQNPISKRMNQAFSEVNQCYSILQNQADNADKIVQYCYSSNGIRLFFYSQSIQQIQNSWLYGHGLGGLDIVTAIKQEDGQLQRASNPHNEYLLQGVQSGVIGMGLLLAIFIFAYREAWALSGTRRYILTAFVLIYATSCLFNSFLMDSAEGILFIALLSTIISQYTQGRSHHETHHT